MGGNEGIQFVPENNELMRGSYAMMDALGRFYTNVDGGHSYGPSILDIGVQKAWSRTDSSKNGFTSEAESMLGIQTFENSQ